MLPEPPGGAARRQNGSGRPGAGHSRTPSSSNIVQLRIILADIAVNWTVFSTIGGNTLYGAVNQTLFATFLAITASPLWQWFRSGRE